MAQSPNPDGTVDITVVTDKVNFLCAKIYQILSRVFKLTFFLLLVPHIGGTVCDINDIGPGPI